MRYFTFLKSFILALSICMAGSLTQAQTIGELYPKVHTWVKQADNGATQIDKGTTLTKALETLKQRFSVVFLYEVGALEDKRVQRNISLSKSLEQSLDDLLDNYPLAFKSLNPKTYAIYSTEKSVPHKVARIQQEVSGTVTDASTGETLPGVNILVKGTRTGTSTDVDGNYELQVESLQDTLVFSFIGYQTQEVPINGRTQVNVALQPQTISGEELVVVGFGTQQKRDLTGSVATVDVSEINKIVTTDPVKSLQGKLAGVSVESSSGAPGAGINVTIRGTGTVNNNDPLFVVDGMLVGNIQSLAPSDIESIQVLKDASAAAIYGSRAANGVVIVTTKQGKAGDIQVNFDAYYGTQRIINYLDLTNSSEYTSLNNRARQEAGADPLPGNVPVSEGGLWDPSVSTDWQDQMYGGIHPIQNYHLRFSGGSENGTYNVSLGYFDQDGVMLNTGFERYSIRVNSETSFGKLRLGENIALTNRNEQRVTNVGRDTEVQILRMAPTIPVFDNSRLGGYAGTNTNDHGDVSSVANPVGVMNLHSNDYETYNLVGNIFGELDLLPQLYYKVNVGLDMGTNHNFFYRPLYDLGQFWKPDLNQINEGRGFFTVWLVDNTLNYKESFGDHTLGALLGTTAEHHSSRNMGGSVSNLLGDGKLRVLGAGQTISNLSGGASGSSLLSYFGRLTYNYKDKYLFTGTIRRDGSSKFAEGNRWGTFPSASVAWRISNEDFFEPWNSVVDDLKLRISYGQLGNQSIGRYEFASLINFNSGYPLGGPADPGPQPRNAITPGASITELSNRDIQWETTTSRNIGIDMTMLNSKLDITADYYIRTTSDMLTRIPIPGSTGALSSPTVNVGEIENSGIEFSATYRDNPGRDFNYSISANFFTNNNEVIQLSGRADESGIRAGRIESNVFSTTWTKPGYPIGAFFLYDVVGIYQNEADLSDNFIKGRNAAPGDLEIRDVNKDSTLTEDDLIFMGSPIPKIQGGLNFSASYKNFDASIFFNWVYGNKLFNGLKFWTESGNGDFNYHRNMLDAWTPDNRDTDIPRLAYGDPAGNSRLPTDRWLFDGSYLRLKNIQLGYTLPTELMSNTLGSRAQLRIYVTAQDLFTLTGYEGYNPELGRDGKFNRGIDRGSYPLQKIFLGGIQLSY